MKIMMLILMGVPLQAWAGAGDWCSPEPEERNAPCVPYDDEKEDIVEHVRQGLEAKEKYREAFMDDKKLRAIVTVDRSYENLEAAAAARTIIIASTQETVASIGGDKNRGTRSTATP